MSDMGDLRGDIDSFFDQLKKEHGLAEEDDGELELDEVPEPPDPTPPAPASSEPPGSPAIPEAVEVEDDEGDTYPGSRHVRRGLTEEPPEEEPEVVWDERPRVYRVRGKDREFFTISALAQALRRQAGTLRKWEEQGYLPRARYRAPGEGKSQARLYTRQQIQGLVVLATEEGLMQPKKKMRIDQTRFPERAQKLFAALEKRST